MIALLLRRRHGGPGAATSQPQKRTRTRTTGNRDYQRAKLYRWERDHVFPKLPQTLSLDACETLVLKAYRWWERPSGLNWRWSPPLVTDGRGRRHACGSREIIKLPRWARTVPVVLHECAHGMSDDKHGPAFVRVYIELLGEFTELPMAELKSSLARARIDMAPPYCR